jgi:hypothetical protein
VSGSHYIHPTVREPTAREVSSHPTRKKLQEHKATHDFLLTLAASLNQLQSVALAERNILQLSYRSLAHSLFTNAGSPSDPVAFARFQRGRYGMQLFQQFASPPFLEFVRARTKGDFVKEHESALLARTHALIARHTPPAHALVTATLEYVNEWKVRYNNENRGAPLGMCQVMKDDIPCCEYFMSAVDQLTFALMMNQLSDCPSPIVEMSSRFRVDPKEALAAKLAAASDGAPLSRWTQEELAEDPNIETIRDITDEPSFVIQKADEAAKLLIVGGDHAFGIGDWILFFLELEALLRPIFAVEWVQDAIYGEPEFASKLMAGIVRGHDPMFLRGFISQAILVIGTLRGANNPLFEGLDEIGNPINQKIVTAFANLSNWFGFKMEIFTAAMGESAPPS